MRAQGVVTLSEHEDRGSDYTLAFVEEGPLRLTLDAARAGNEARFINDFRGVPVAAGAGCRGGANVRFAPRVDERGQTQMGVYVLPGSTAGVAKGAELLLSYGKGYWLARGLLRSAGQEQAQEEEEEEEELAAAAEALSLGDKASTQPA